MSRPPRGERRGGAGSTWAGPGWCAGPRLRGRARANGQRQAARPAPEPQSRPLAAWRRRGGERGGEQPPAPLPPSGHQDGRGLCQDAATVREPGAGLGGPGRRPPAPQPERPGARARAARRVSAAAPAGPACAAAERAHSAEEAERRRGPGEWPWSARGAVGRPAGPRRRALEVGEMAGLHWRGPGRARLGGAFRSSAGHPSPQMHLTEPSGTRASPEGGLFAASEGKLQVSLD